ncbi:MAG: CDP-diacylglycerol--glycerol-3-phosphate 3-phosphatidyltransferase [Gammaproteobacteria bacterium]|nr:CDP-diacylglycerol--glycerol-3-phosphate 3-phosphatidyltransferase [Gammaproteobacteria bacterium]
MPRNLPNLLTFLRIGLIPVLVVVYYLPSPWTNEVVTGMFVLAAVTDWLDGYLARRLNASSAFGAFLDPVADKLMVSSALVVLVADPRVLDSVLDARLFAVIVAIIVGREIVISALREWMADLGARAQVAVSRVGKYKTTLQMIAIILLLYREDLWGLPIVRIGEFTLLGAAVLTLWSMVIYLHSAWPVLMGERPVRRES